MKSSYDVHVMRDHPAHSAYMMGGTWGVKVDQVRKDLIYSFKDIFKVIQPYFFFKTKLELTGFFFTFKDGVSYYSRDVGFGYDQHILTHYLWPWAKKVAMCHDSYTCKKFSKTFPFPTRRKEGVIGNYVGSVVLLNATIDSDCPEKCRPSNHKDWTKC